MRACGGKPRMREMSDACLDRFRRHAVGCKDPRCKMGGHPYLIHFFKASGPARGQPICLRPVLTILSRTLQRALPLPPPTPPRAPVSPSHNSKPHRNSPTTLAQRSAARDGKESAPPSSRRLCPAALSIRARWLRCSITLPLGCVAASALSCPCCSPLPSRANARAPGPVS